MRSEPRKYSFMNLAKVQSKVGPVQRLGLQMSALVVITYSRLYQPSMREEKYMYAQDVLP